MKNVRVEDLGSMVQVIGADKGDGTALVSVILLAVDETGENTVLTTFKADKDNTDPTAWLVEAHAKIAAAFGK